MTGEAGDLLGLRRADGGGLPVAIAAMAFVAALAVAADGAARATGEAFWATGDRARTVLIPDPDTTRVAAALAVLHDDAGVLAARTLDTAEVAGLLRPWVGSDEFGDLPMPGVIAVVLRPGAADDGLATTLAAAAAGATISDQDDQLATAKQVMDEVRLLAGGVLAAIGVAGGVLVAVATRATLLLRRETVEIAHGLGAEDGWIVGRLGRIGAARAAVGALFGVCTALPPLVALAWSAPTMSGAPSSAGSLVARVPVPVQTWAGLAAIPVIAALIGWLAASSVARAWLRRLT